MSSPVELSDLPVATSADNADVTLLRKGLTDYQCAVSLIRNINVAALAPIPGGSAVSTDLMLISRTLSGTPQNFNIRFSQVSFPKGTRMWFYNSLPPTGWSVVPNTGGNLLAAQDFGMTYAGNATAGNVAGTWQQTDTALTIDQIPAHAHVGRVRKNKDGTLDGLFAGTQATNSQNNATTNMTGGAGSSNTASSNPVGGTNGHNHGNTWRPLANVGVIGNKDS